MDIDSPLHPVLPRRLPPDLSEIANDIAARAGSAGSATIKDRVMSGSSGVCRRMDGTLLAEVSFDVVVMHHGHAADGMGRGCRGAEATRQCSTTTSQHPLARWRASLRSLRRGRLLEHGSVQRDSEAVGRCGEKGEGGGTFWV